MTPQQAESLSTLRTKLFEYKGRMATKILTDRAEIKFFDEGVTLFELTQVSMRQRLSDQGLVAKELEILKHRIKQERLEVEEMEHLSQVLEAVIGLISIELDWFARQPRG